MQHWLFEKKGEFGMKYRTVKRVLDSEKHRIGSLIMYQPLPAGDLEQIDPFLLLHHHGPNKLGPHNSGLPFAPHPHRGFETVTLIFEGNVVHHDSHGFSSRIQEGGVQWMTAGKGIIHSENIDARMREQGGTLEIIQLWVNLPARLKMMEANYQGFQKEEIPLLSLANGKLAVNLISGIFDGSKGPVNSITGIDLSTIFMKAGGIFETEIDSARNILLYTLDGEVLITGIKSGGRALAEFDNDGSGLLIEAITDSRLILGSGMPYHEPVAAHGPFVMNTSTEIREAINDYQAGKMGILEE
mgnify:CR=1 FL=1